MEPLWKTMEIVPLLLLTSKEKSLSMKLCLLEVSLEEESLSSVSLFWKDQDGTFLTITMLSLTSSVKDKDAHSSLAHAAVLAPSSMTTAQAAARDALHMVEEVDTVRVTHCLTIADITTLVKTMTVRMMMVITMLLYPVSKYTVDQQEANVSLVLWLQRVALARTLSVSSTVVLEVVLLLNLKYKLEITRLFALKKNKRP